MSDDAKPPRHHLLIAGTGRAGTSFLVRYLDALGLETHFTRFGELASWDEAANAGAEDLPLPAIRDDLPYVVKSPWIVELIDQLLADPAIVIDAVVIPLRDLMDAAASRSTVELRHFAQENEWATKLDRPWEHWGRTPGGIVYSLHPLDQARILAMGFYRLVERLTAADIPIILLGFPRFVRDADYLHARLAPVLGGVSAGQARAAHAALADPAKVRVERERAEPGPAGPDLASLDRAALNREIERLRGEIATLERRQEELLAHAAGLAEHARRIEESRMWRAMAPLRRALHRIGPRRENS
ncbi:MAG TPA: hypothetical protein VFN77_10540 [Acetobacteraceae bacterium]|nr:hypothetical protein [Acetobacteraceae bacterium]